MSRPEYWTYRGVMIHREYAPNGAGLRYWSLGTGTMLRGQTLADMRDLIRDAVTG